MELKDWFVKKDYSAGVQLFEKYYPNNTFLLKLLKASKTSFTITELEKHLKKQLDTVNHKPEIIEKKVTVEKSSVKVPEAKKPIEPKPKAVEKAVLKPNLWLYDEDTSEDENVKLLVANRKALYVKRTQLKAQYNQMVWFHKKFSNKERGDLGKELTATCKALEECWKDVLYFRKKGFLPDKSIDKRQKDIETNQLQKRLNNVRTYLTKINKGILSIKLQPKYEAELESILLKLQEAYEANNEK